MYKNILIATDGSALADKAVDSGIALAKALGASVVVLTATEPWTARIARRRFPESRPFLGPSARTSASLEPAAGR